MIPQRCPLCGNAPVISIPNDLPVFIRSGEQSREYHLRVFICYQSGHVFLIPESELHQESDAEGEHVA
jgi:hypothetical protein